MKALRTVLFARGLAESVDLEVAGGIDERPALTRRTAAGANILVSGSAVFGHDRPLGAIRAIRAAAPC